MADDSRLRRRRSPKESKFFCCLADGSDAFQWPRPNREPKRRSEKQASECSVSSRQRIPMVKGNKNASDDSANIATTFVLTGAVAGLFGAGVGIFAESSEAVLDSLANHGRCACRSGPLERVLSDTCFSDRRLGLPFGLGYWRHQDHPLSGKRLPVLLGFLCGRHEPACHQPPRPRSYWDGSSWPYLHFFW